MKTTIIFIGPGPNRLCLDKRTAVVVAEGRLWKMHTREFVKASRFVRIISKFFESAEAIDECRLTDGEILGFAQ